MCWAFGVCEGDLRELYWRYSFYELVQRIQLKYGELVASHLTQYNALAQVVSHALGGPVSKPAPVQTTGSLEGDVAMINGLLRMG